MRRGVVVATVLLGLCAGAVAGESPSEELVLLALDGSPATIVIPDTSTRVERSAADELAGYLEEMTGVRWPVKTEARAPAGESARILVGATDAAREAGIETSGLGEEEWMLRTSADDLLVVGGRGRGTLYAAYHLLEDHLGVHWWTPFEETVPLRPTITLPHIDRSGRPAFAYRDVDGVPGPAPFHARNRLNGHFSYVLPALGGRHAYGPPFQVHTFYSYVPPETYFAERPELFAERGGERITERSQLCLTNAGLADLVVERLRGFIEQGRRDSKARGEAPPRIYSLSPNDYPRPCRCDDCSRRTRQAGSHAGPLIDLVNAVAGKIAKDHPEILIDTLAYQHTFDPPADAHARPNVVVRLAALEDRDLLKPAAHPANARYGRAIDGWRKRTDRLRIWQYAVTFGHEPNNFPLPDLPVIAEDFRLYRSKKVDGIYVQHQHPVLGDLKDLKLWVAAKLLEDPRQDLGALIETFTDGYYGAAGPLVRRYLADLRAAAVRRGSRITIPTDAEQFDYLTPSFLREAHELFDEAERRVADDLRLVRRVREARISLDRATLWIRDDETGIEPSVVAERLRRATGGRIDRLLPASIRDERRASIDREIGTALETRVDRGRRAR